MANERVLNLRKFDISRARYEELRGFCRQYREKQSQLRSITEIGANKFIGGGRGLSDKTATLGVKKAQLERDIEIIEQAAIEADSDIYEYIIAHVVDRVPIQYLGVPCSESTFKRRRRMFYYLLDKKKS